MLNRKEVQQIIKESYTRGLKMGLLIGVVAVIITLIIK